MAARNAPVVHSPSSSGLAEVLDIILDKGIVIDAFVRVSVLGIELITVDIRVVVASVDTYLRFAEAVHRLNMRAQTGAIGIDGLAGSGRPLSANLEQRRQEIGAGQLAGANA